MTTDQIISDKKILKEMSPEDAHMTGYLTAVEQMLLEKELLEKQKIGVSK